MKLSPHFSLTELTRSSTAAALGLDNTPAPEVVPRLIRTAEMLERIRTALGVPVTVTSGYRAPAVNRAVGGVTSSDHAQGHAADIIAPGFGTPYQIAKKLEPLIDAMGVGQLIFEHVAGKTWVHVSTRTPDKISNRVITIGNSGARLGIQVAA